MAKGREVTVAATDDETAVHAIQRASQGDETAMSEVREAFDVHPGVWRLLGDMARRAEDALIGASFTEKDLAGREAARRYLADLHTQLAGPDSSPLERVLAERAALALYDASRLDREALSRTDLTWQTADLLDRRRSRAHARALAAVRSLAVVRRLLKGGPAVAVGVQVNVGRDTEVQQSG